MKAIFKGIPYWIKQELESEIDDSESVDVLCNHECEECEIKLVCLVDEDDFESNYYTVTFDDGFKFEALSGMYFRKVY